MAAFCPQGDWEGGETIIKLPHQGRRQALSRGFPPAVPMPGSPSVGRPVGYLHWSCASLGLGTRAALKTSALPASCLSLVFILLSRTAYGNSTILRCSHLLHKTASCAACNSCVFPQTASWICEEKEPSGERRSVPGRDPRPRVIDAYHCCPDIAFLLQPQFPYLGTGSNLDGRRSF